MAPILIEVDVPSQADSASIRERSPRKYSGQLAQNLSDALSSGCRNEQASTKPSCVLHTLESTWRPEATSQESARSINHSTAYR